MVSFEKIRKWNEILKLLTLICFGGLLYGIYDNSLASKVVPICRVNKKMFVCGTQSLDESSIGLFKENCASCHKMDKKSVGPKLRGFLRGGINKEWVKSFLLNEDLLIIANDSLVKIINEKEGAINFSHKFIFLTEKELEVLINVME